MNPLEHEWLVTNGLGGYASCTVAGVTTRKYHAQLVAMLPPPLGRSIMLNHISEELIIGKNKMVFGCEETKDNHSNLTGLRFLKDFYLEQGLPVWRYEWDDVVFEKKVMMIYRQNTSLISFRLIKGPAKVKLNLQISVNFRKQEANLYDDEEKPYGITVIEKRFEIIREPFPPLRLYVDYPNVQFTLANRYKHNIFFRVEAERGYEEVGYLWTPGFFTLDLTPGTTATLVASTEDWPTLCALTPEEAFLAEYDRRNKLLSYAPDIAKNKTGKCFIFAADQFIFMPKNRIKDAARAFATGDELRSIIAGYHWFTDWGRDTMISLEGLTLCTQRYDEALGILKTFIYYVKNGLIPNKFSNNEAMYYTADATLWLFHAVDRYIQITNDIEFIPRFFNTFENIIEHHINGTSFNIVMDPQDGLIKQGYKEYPLTWMDARVDDWIVTPRRGKPVEINALWFNALKLMEEWSHILNKKKLSQHYSCLARKVSESFNKKFWFAEKNYLYDVIDSEDGIDSSLRPNQLFSISLKYPVLDKKKWHSVLTLCQEKLLTPFGLRSLSPDDPHYQPRYDGDRRARDAAYHQGTVWPWLIGAFVDAWIKVNPDKKNEAQQFIEPLINYFKNEGLCTINEIFDANKPYAPRGCMTQAWSIAEVLRCWLKINS